MRLTLHLLGVEVFDLAINEPATFEAAEFEPYQDAGTTGATIIGFTQDPPAIWEDGGWRRGYDEPGEGHEDV